MSPVRVSEGVVSLVAKTLIFTVITLVLISSVQKK